ncbi:MAG: hypothetical protein M3P50_05715 [Actinomycetota bacterium]|nr:hypothetical protein [Actinomycetota bacterium]
MGPDTGKHIRNILIIVGLALAVWLLPGGDTGSAFIGNLLSVILLGGLAFFAYRMYMEHRITLLDLEGRTRAALYACFGLIVFAIAAAGRMWGSGPGALVWIALMAVAAYGIYSVYRAAREY